MLLSFCLLFIQMFRVQILGSTDGKGFPTQAFYEDGKLNIFTNFKKDIYIQQAYLTPGADVVNNFYPRLITISTSRNV